MGGEGTWSLCAFARLCFHFENLHIYNEGFSCKWMIEVHHPGGIRKGNNGERLTVWGLIDRAGLNIRRQFLSAERYLLVVIIGSKHILDWEINALVLSRFHPGQSIF